MRHTLTCSKEGETEYRITSGADFSSRYSSPELLFETARELGIGLTDQEQKWFRELSDRCLGDLSMEIQKFDTEEAVADELKNLTHNQGFEISEDVYDDCITAKSIIHVFAFTETQNGFYDFLASTMTDALEATHGFIFE